MTPAATYSGLPRSATDARGLWEPKRTLTLEAARRHSQMIRYIRWAMLSAAALLVLTIIVQFMTQKSRVVVEESLVDSVKMINPRYTGRTADNLPFYLTALTATRALDNRHEVKLEKPVLEFIRGAGMESSFVEAESGSYDDVKKILNLQAAVNMRSRTIMRSLFLKTV